MTALPAKTSISDTYPNPSNATARAGFAVLWDVINEMLQASEIELAAGTTCDIGGQTSTKLKIYGSPTTITSFGTNYRGPILLRFAGAQTIQQNASTLHCPGAVDLVTATEDVLLAYPVSWLNTGTPDGWKVIVLERGTGLTPIASGGTGASTAAAAFTALKQAATTSATGVVELATDAEAQAGTDATRCVTPDNLGATVLGIGQAWTDVKTTPGRAPSTTYTNSTGRPIQIMVSANINTTNQWLVLTVNGSTVALSDGTYAIGALVNISGVVIPAGATYSITASSGVVTIQTWLELR
jgi:hypothetical protein